MKLKPMFVLLFTLLIQFAHSQNMYLHHTAAAGGTVDTYLINDVRKLTFDPGMINVVKTDNTTVTETISEVRKLTFDIVTSAEEMNQIPVKQGVIKLFPNPTNGDISIAYLLTEKSNVEIRIYDLQGRKVKEVIKNDQLAGNYEYSIDLNDENGNKIQAGTYLFEVIINGQKVTHKVSVL